MLPLQVLGKELLVHNSLLASCSPMSSFLTLQMYHPNPPSLHGILCMLSSHHLPFVYVSVSKFSLFKVTSHVGLGPNLMISFKFISIKTLFPNKITFRGLRGWNFNILFFQGEDTTQSHYHLKI